MEDNKIRDLFKEFQPELSSDRLFMARLQRSMEAVEIVKQHNAKVQRRNRVAVITAAISGFVSGVILTLFYPVISAWLSSIAISLPSIGIPEFNIDGHIASWLLIGGLCATIAISVYDFTLSRLTFNQHINSTQSGPIR